MQNKLFEITEWQLHTCNYIQVTRTMQLYPLFLQNKMSIQSFTVQHWMESHEIHFGIINSNDSSNYKISQYDIYTVVLSFSYITDRFRIQNKYVLFNTVHIFIILNGALTENYITIKPSSLPKIKKEKPAKSLTSFDLLKHKTILAKGRHKGPCNLFWNEVCKW